MRITEEEFRKLERIDYAGIGADGQARKLALCPETGATESVPVTIVSHCEGCDENQENVREYLVQFDTSLRPEPELVRYCPDCAALAQLNWNGETVWCTPAESGATADRAFRAEYTAAASPPAAIAQMLKALRAAPTTEPEYEDWGGDTEQAEMYGLAAGAYEVAINVRPGVREFVRYIAEIASIADTAIGLLDNLDEPLVTPVLRERMARVRAGTL